MKKAIITFGLVSDCQYTDEDDETYIIPTPEQLSYDCRYRESPERLRQAINFLNTQQLDFVVHLGDFIDRRFTEIEPLNTITQLSKAPFWHVLGNHEYKDKSTPIESVVSVYGMPHRYYVKDVSSYRFIIIDSNEEGVIVPVEESDEYKSGQAYINALRQAGRGNARPWNGGVSDTQLAWIELQIQAAEKQGKNVILFSHHPIFPPGPLNMLNDIEFLTMIAKHSSVRAFFNGHNHLGNFAQKNSIPYITAAGIVEGEGNAYGTVTLYDDGSGTLTGYGRQASYSW